jgi:hypothetical protein
MPYSRPGAHILAFDQNMGRLVADITQHFYVKRLGLRFCNEQVTCEPIFQPNR